MLIFESSNLLLPTPVVTGLVMLVRWLQGRDYRFISDHERTCVRFSLGSNETTAVLNPTMLLHTEPPEFGRDIASKNSSLRLHAISLG